jgi:nanoRNase/pAp phosphatase (c-di-AMP/oligoRNAs hydrolase)
LLTLLRKSNGLVVVSVRSRNGEAIKVASLLQGGGHANAAGATLPRSVQRIPDAVAYLKKVLNPAPAPVQRGAADLDSAF